MPTTPDSLIPPAVWQSLTFEWLWVYHGYVPIQAIWSSEVSVPSGWFWVECGLVKIRAGDREITLKAGQSFFSAPGMRQQWFAKGTRLMSVGLRGLWPGGLPLYQSGLNLALTAAKTKTMLAATQELFRAVHGLQKSVSYQEGIITPSRSLLDWSRHEAAFRAWFAVYASQLQQCGVPLQPRTSFKDRRLATVCAAMSDWPLDQPFRASPLALMVGLGERRVLDLIRAHFGMSAQVWMERRRLEVARQRLISEDTALKEIAFALGFRHPPHFTTWFKKRTGITPTACRQGLSTQGA